MPDKIKRSFKEALHLASVSEQLAAFKAIVPEEKTKVKDILGSFHEKGFTIALIFFALPVAIPLPYPPGFTTIVGTPLILLAIQMLLKYEQVKLPRKIAEFEIKNSTLIMIASKAGSLIEKVEKLMKPRFKFASSIIGEQIIGFMTLLCAISIAIPLPLTNSIPAWGITIMSLGLIKNDGVVILGGIITGIIGLIIAAIATFIALAGLKHLFFMFF